MFYGIFTFTSICLWGVPLSISGINGMYFGLCFALPWIYFLNKFKIEETRNIKYLLAHLKYMLVPTVIFILSTLILLSWH